MGLVLIAAVAACRPHAREYPLRGQVLAVAAGRAEVTVKHEDIPGFMPAMTMVYHVKDATLLTGVIAGDLITATLRVPSGEIPSLTQITRTGHADVPAEPATPGVVDFLQPGDVVPDDPLQDQAGATRRLSEWRGRALAVTFIYTRCPMPDFCPLMERKFAAAQRTIAADATLKDAVHLVSVSFDPDYDTPAVLATHAKAIGADVRMWSFLTGPEPTITRFASRFGVSVAGDDAGPAITHNLRTAVIDRDGRVVKIYSGSDWLPETLVNDLRDAGRR